MLADFLHTHRQELIDRCSFKVSQRSAPGGEDPAYGVPLVLDQLSEALVEQNAAPMSQESAVFGEAPKTASWVEARRTAALHGAALFRLGYRLDEVVYDYGDVCQAVTELATELSASVTLDEFHTLNRLLDTAIAQAVSAFAALQASRSTEEGARTLHERLGRLADEQRVLLNVALSSPTSAALQDALAKLRTTVDRSLPEIRVDTGMLTARSNG